MTGAVAAPATIAGLDQVTTIESNTPAVTPAPAAPQGDQPAQQDRPRDEQGRFLPKEGEPAADKTDTAAPEAGAQAGQDAGLTPRQVRNRERWNEMRSRIRDLEGQVQQFRQQAETKWQAAQKPLDPQQFASDAEYQAALSAQYMRRELAQDDLQQAAAVRQQAQATREQALDANVDSYRERIPDIDVIFKQPREGGPIVSDAMAAVIYESDAGPLIAYHLAKNPDEARRISTMPPLAAARALGRLEADLSMPGRKISAAPKPLQTLNGAAQIDSKDPAKMDMKEFEGWFMKEKGF